MLKTKSKRKNNKSVELLKKVEKTYKTYKGNINKKPVRTGSNMKKMLENLKR